MYCLVSIIFVVIRQIYIPNPFGPGLSASVLNYIVEPVLYKGTYGVVGMFYEKGENPIMGSILYMIFYCIHTAIIFLLGKYSWNVIAVILVTIGYSVVLLGIRIKMDEIKHIMV